ncbi:MAG TPA: hypothetical protein VFZ66_05180 [Herpetosiphonaceae bacterium]
MSEQPVDRWAPQLEETARSFSYPPTPDIAGAVSRQLLARQARRPVERRRMVWALAALSLLIAGLLLVPPVRAGILEVLRIGAVRILLVEPTATPLPPTPASTSAQTTIMPPPTATSAIMPPPTATGPMSAQTTITATPASSVLDLEGETTLAEAQERLDFPIRLPTYPADLGSPRVFVQDFGEPVLIVVWLDQAQPDRVRLSLYQIPPGPYAEKSRPENIKSTTVNGRPALWAEGRHFLITRSGDAVFRRLVEGHVLIWTEGTITYRLETDLSEAEAIRVAESLR